jgi:hypothetical protein
MREALCEALQQTCCVKPLITKRPMAAPFRGRPQGISIQDRGFWPVIEFRMLLIHNHL